MRFLHQIKFEIKNIIRSKFLLIIGILILAASIAVPVIGLINENRRKNNYPIEPTWIGKMDGEEAVDYNDKGEPQKNLESITINGVTIYADNAFYWQLQDLVRQRVDFENNSGMFSSPDVLDTVLAMIDMETDYYLRYAQKITTYEDYRYELSWQGIETLYDKFYYENADLGLDILSEASNYRRGTDPTTLKNKYIDITPQQRLEGIALADENLELLYDIVENSNFPKYIDLKIRLANEQIKNIEDNIVLQQELIIKNPDQEDNINAYIEDLRRQIESIKTGTIPVLELRLEKNIIPGADVWQNRAISDIENSKNQLAYMKIMTEKEFNEWQQGGGGGPVRDVVYAENMAMSSKYGGYDYYYPGYYPGGNYDTYKEYVAYMQGQIDRLNKAIVIAEKSLATDKPDMKYVPEGSRSRTVTFLDYSIFIALFGVLLGGWLIASEHQQGTIRLLMIRPRTRLKILAAKFTAALVICVGIYLAGSLLHLVTNGVIYGFADYSFPNYNVAGAVSYPAYYLPKLLVCIVPILFAFTLAFMLSVVVKNVAVSIAVPFAFFIGSMITVTIMAATSSMSWLAYTPIPFIMLSQFFHESMFKNIMEYGGISISLTYGVLLLAALTALCAGIAALVFKKKDIVN